MSIGFHHEDGRRERLTPETFGRMFGVRYQPRMPPADRAAKEFLAQCAGYRPAEPENSGRAGVDSRRRRIAAGRPAATYIKKVGDEVGFGLFACRELRPGRLIGEYTGALTKDWSEEVGGAADFRPYLLRFPFDSEYAIDAAKQGNETRFVNHSEHPNVRRRYRLHRGVLHVLLVADRTIPRDGQILLDYGRDYWRFSKPVDPTRRQAA